jgi:rubrerythrin
MSITERSQDLAGARGTRELPSPMPFLDPVKPEPGALGRHELRCTTCGYGAVIRLVPEQCPMCAGTSWELAD